MLVAAAAEAWKVPASGVKAEKSVLSHASGQRPTYGEMAAAAAKQAPPANPTLKAPAQFTLMGKSDATPRVDSAEKCNGTAMYTIDVKLPGLLTAVIAWPPSFGAKLVSFDAVEAKKVKGVSDVVQVPEGVAVVGRGTWAVLQGRRALKMVWDEAESGKLDSDALLALYKAQAATAGLYQPMFVHAVKAGIDAQGRISGWQHTVVGQSIVAGTPMEMMIKDGIDPNSVEGVSPTPYTLPMFSGDLHSPALAVKPLWWRSVGNTHTAYVMETMMDELARTAGKDPLAFRLALLAKSDRAAGVLRLAADKAGWGKPKRAGLAQGIAMHESFGSFVAQVADVTMKNGKVKVEPVVCAVDCGIAVNPDGPSRSLFTISQRCVERRAVSETR